MKLLKISLISLLTIFSFVLTPSVFAITQMETEEVKEGQERNLITLSNVSFSNVDVVVEEGNKLNISFTIKNKEGSHSGVKYGLSLYRTEDTPEGYKKIIYADQYVFPEILTIEPNSETLKEVSYEAPLGLSGEYSLMLSLGNKEGFSLAVFDYYKNKISFNSEIKTASIISNTCAFSDSNNPDKVIKDFYQTLYMDKDGDSTISCLVKNDSSESLTVTPSMEIFSDSLYGESVGDVEKLTEVDFKAGEEKTISWILPKSSEDRIFVAKIYLEGNSGVFSNNVLAKYSNIGEEGSSIKNISLDKTFYKKGDKVNLSVYWLSEKKDEDLTLTAQILNNKGKECLTELSQANISGSYTELTGTMNKDCKDPKVSVQIKDAGGNILAENQSTFQSPEKAGPVILDIVILALIVILVVAGIIIFLVKPKNKKEELKNNENINHEINN